MAGGGFVNVASSTAGGCFVVVVVSSVPSFVHACCFGLCLFGVLACCRCILYGHGLEEYRRGHMCGRGGYEMGRKPTSLTFGHMAEEN